MSGWTPAAVRAAAAEWIWVPTDAEQVLTSEYQLIAYPAHYQHPTQVAWSSAGRPASELIEEVLSQACAWGRDSVYWWVRDDTAPTDTEAVLQARGATLTETVQVLVYDLANGVPELSLVNGPQAELVRDVDGQPAAGGGCSIVGEVARLWGAGTRPPFRGRGAYRALLAARIRIAKQHGATLALVKGRLKTSGPILRRAGFTPYAEERSYCVPVPA
jgi:GNAT superfamily N-acetyltransferase